MAGEIPENLLYSVEHEWFDPGSGWMGITDHAQDELGDVVFVELPEAGKQLTAGEPFMVVESMKAVSDIYAPVDGRVADRNDSLEDNPEKVNSDPYSDGRLVRIENPGDSSDLMDSEKYSAYLENQ
ncbi:MAG: glycine cleavage system protein GcvH [bacterium]